MKRFEVWLVALDPTIGSEIKKTRPAVIVSPDDVNSMLHTVIVVPLSKGKEYPFRIPTVFQGKSGVAAIDQVRSVDKLRLQRKVGVISADTGAQILSALAEMFAI